MSNKDDIRKFLVSRRANVTLAQVGLPDFGDERRVPGLRREEVAQLAGVSIDYYTRLERGNIHGASESVLNAIARALQLTDVEREHLLDLARPASAAANVPGRTTAAVTVRPSVQRVLDSLAVPAVVYNARQDLVASNLLGRALFSPHFDSDRPNMARFIFLDSRAKDYYADWPLACSLTAAMLRYEAGRDPLHAEVGDLDLTYDVFEMPGEPGLSIGTYTADEGSETADKLILLAAWAATQEFGSRPSQPEG